MVKNVDCIPFGKTTQQNNISSKIEYVLNDSDLSEVGNMMFDILISNVNNRCRSPWEL